MILCFLKLFEASWDSLGLLEFSWGFSRLLGAPGSFSGLLGAPRGFSRLFQVFRSSAEHLQRSATAPNLANRPNKLPNVVMILNLIVIWTNFNFSMYSKGVALHTMKASKYFFCICSMFDNVLLQFKLHPMSSSYTVNSFFSWFVLCNLRENKLFRILWETASPSLNNRLALSIHTNTHTQVKIVHSAPLENSNNCS